MEKHSPPIPLSVGAPSGGRWPLSHADGEETGWAMLAVQDWVLGSCPADPFVFFTSPLRPGPVRPVSQKISYRCICNLWISSLSIYYRLIIIIIVVVVDYVNPPSVCLSHWSSEVARVEDTRVPPAARLCCPGDNLKAGPAPPPFAFSSALVRVARGWPGASA